MDDDVALVIAGGDDVVSVGETWMVVDFDSGGDGSAGVNVGEEGRGVESMAGGTLEGDTFSLLIL